MAVSFRVRLGRRLAELRELAGMTQADLSERAAIPARSISNWEQGDAAIPLEKALELCQALGVTISDLLEIPEQTERRGPGKPPVRKTE